jgi:hypothetical protein
VSLLWTSSSPIRIAELVAQLLFWAGIAAVFGAEYEQEHGEVVAQREPSDLSAGRVVGDVDELVARRVSVNHESCDLAAEVVLVVVVGPEDQTPNVGVQPVGADHEVEFPWRAVVEGHGCAAVGIVVPVRSASACGRPGATSGPAQRRRRRHR